MLLGKPSLINRLPAQWTVAADGSTAAILNFSPATAGENANESPAGHRFKK